MCLFFFLTVHTGPNRTHLQNAIAFWIGGRLWALPVADEANNKEWQSSKKTSFDEVWLANDNRATLGSAFSAKADGSSLTRG